MTGMLKSIKHKKLFCAAIEIVNTINPYMTRLYAHGMYVGLIKVKSCLIPHKSVAPGVTVLYAKKPNTPPLTCHSCNRNSLSMLIGILTKALIEATVKSPWYLKWNTKDTFPQSKCACRRAHKAVIMFVYFKALLLNACIPFPLYGGKSASSTESA